MLFLMAILYRLRQVRRADLFAAGQVGNGARQLNNAMERWRRQPQLRHRQPQQAYS